MAEYEIIPLVLGKLPIDKSFMTYLSGCGTRIELSVVSFYVKGGNKNILVDTGAPVKGTEKYWSIEPMSEVQTFEEALGKQGLKPKDIDIVIQTHLHWDHVANTAKCTRAKAIVQEDELRFALAPHPLQAGMYGVEFLQGLKFQLVRGDTEIVDGIKVLLTPGHTPGSQSVAIETTKGTAIIAGFCCVRETFEVSPDDMQAIPGWLVYTPGIHTDALAAFDNAVKIKGLADILVPNHEPELVEIEKIP